MEILSIAISAGKVDATELHGGLPQPSSGIQGRGGSDQAHGGRIRLSQ
jgi:hypothetical protein